MGELPFKIFRHISFFFLFSLYLSFPGCIGGGSDLGGGSGAGGSPITNGSPPPGPGGSGGFTPPSITAIGGGQGAAPPMESGALGPMTDYSKAVLALNCGQSSCVIKPPIVGEQNDSEICEFTYKVKGMLKITPGNVPIPDRVLRVRDKDTAKFRDVVTDAGGQFEITVTVDENPRIEFWATDLAPGEAGAAGWTDCAGTCIESHFLKINLSYSPSCSYLNTEPILQHSNNPTPRMQ